MRAIRALMRIVLACAVLGCIAASCFFAFEFGATRSSDYYVSWAFALVALFLDLLKAGLPLLAADSDDIGYKRGCWFAFIFLTCMSLWSAYGVTATQLASRLANKIVAESDKTTKEGTFKRLRDERAALGTFTRATPDAVNAAQDAVEAAVKAKDQECGKVGPNCRARNVDETARRAELALVMRDKATTDAAAVLDGKITAAETAFMEANKPDAVRPADPQVENMAKVLGVDQDKVALISHLVLAVSIEIGSGLGLWLVLGHAPADRRKPAQKLIQVVEESDDDLRLRFFQQYVAGATARRVSAADVHAAYADFCAERGRSPMAARAFGRDAPWPKEKIGGQVYYLNCVLNYRPRVMLQLVPPAPAPQRT